MPTLEEIEMRGGFWSIWPRPGMDHLTHETKQKAMQVLCSMANMVSFDLQDFGNTRRKGSCTAPSPVARGRHHMFPGEKSLIELSKKDYVELVRLTLQDTARQVQQGKVVPPSLELVEMCFSMAHRIVHEFSHALSFAAHGIRPRELCYKDSVMAEAGFEFEAQIFGCLINTYTDCVWPDDSPHRSAHHPSVLPPMLIATDWPSPQRAISYREVASLDIWNGGPLQRYELARRVPWSFLMDLLTNDFWYAQHSRQDTLPISVPTFGCCIWWVPTPQPSFMDFESHSRRSRKRRLREV